MFFWEILHKIIIKQKTVPSISAQHATSSYSIPGVFPEADKARQAHTKLFEKYLVLTGLPNTGTLASVAPECISTSGFTPPFVDGFFKLTIHKSNAV
jgi:hypothetical protein